VHRDTDRRGAFGDLIRALIHDEQHRAALAQQGQHAEPVGVIRPGAGEGMRAGVGRRVGRVESRELAGQHPGEARLGGDRLAQQRTQRTDIGGEACDQRALGQRVLRQLRAHRVSFRVVAVEQRGVRPALCDRGQLPPEVHGVLNADVEADAAGREVAVRGVSGQQHAAGPVGRGDARRVAEPRQPRGVVHAEVCAGDALCGVPEFFQGEVFAVLVVRVVQYDFAEKPVRRGLGAGEVDARLPAHSAAGAVGAHDVLRGQLVEAGGASDLERDGGVVLGQRDQLVASPDLSDARAAVCPIPCRNP
jgi:hypothetical protein